jgi:hypothetical protein
MSIAAVRTFPRLAGVMLAGAALAGAALPAHAAPMNPAPAQKLAGYAGYELKPMAIESSLTAKNNSEKVVATVQEHMERTVAPIVAKWNAEAASATSTEKLVIEPKITALHKPSGATRFFAGALAGDGRIVVTVNIHEAGSGKVIATPEFYRRANGMAGAWTVGAHDNAMLGKVVGLIADYLNANYSEAVGGATGYEP